MLSSPGGWEPECTRTHLTKSDVSYPLHVLVNVFIHITTCVTEEQLRTVNIFAFDASLNGENKRMLLEFRRGPVGCDQKYNPTVYFMALYELLYCRKPILKTENPILNAATVRLMKEFGKKNKLWFNETANLYTNHWYDSEISSSLMNKCMWWVCSIDRIISVS